MYYYVQAAITVGGEEQPMWEVGFWTPRHEWKVESEHLASDSAAARVHYLNGGNQHGANLWNEK